MKTMPKRVALCDLSKGQKFEFVDPDTGEDAKGVYADGPFEVTDEVTGRRNSPSHVLVPVKTATGGHAVYDLPMDVPVRVVTA